MTTNELGLSADPEPLLESLARAAQDLPAPGHHGHGGPIETVRESTYRGHRIVVRTTYAITVDGEPVDGHLGVSNDGQVHYHPIPNLAFGSAIELVEKIVDAFPDDFPDPPGYGEGGDAETPGAAPGEPAHDDPGAHDHGDHDHGDR